MLDDIKFQSYCWSLGTTSFRVKDLNFKIERQLQILEELWKENPDIKWNGNNKIQEEYYRAAIEFIKENGINDIEEFFIIDMGRKGTKYVEPMYNFFEELYEISQRNFDEKALDTIVKFIQEQIKKNPKVAKYWKDYLKYSTKISIEEYLEEIKNIPLFNFKNKKEYTLEFFRVMHTAKWKATLEDYADLNKRYISLSDIIIFGEEKIELDLFPRYFFLNISKEIVNTEILSKDKYNDFISKNIEFSEIYNCLDINVDDVIVQIQADYPSRLLNRDSIRTFIEDEKLRRFNELIDNKFNESQLIKLFSSIEHNDRNEILEYADWNSDIPTIFEYILGITWYRFSNKIGNILKYMKLSLDANLLPKAHAAGGTADIVYEYDETNVYPEHKVLLEATLTESTSQRKNEMEPVSRHLMREIQENDNDSTYVVFVANILQEEVLSDFRFRKNYQFRGKNSVKTGLKIISLSIQDIIKLINVKAQYSKLYKMFEIAYKDTEINDLEWYEKLVKNKINNL